MSTVKHSTPNFEFGHTAAKSTVSLKMFVKFNYCLKFNVMKCIFVVVCCIFLEQHFVVIIMVMISYVLKKE